MKMIPFGVDQFSYGHTVRVHRKLKAFTWEDTIYIYIYIYGKLFLQTVDPVMNLLIFWVTELLF